ncbi:outer membrane protein assembly factor BamB family protein [Cellulomonas aerilata]|uniref:Pyrrolo-quinoline quinone repeat domain-containing protein n=1 Tax=Cellulomonas aerilata TaxID=515326 RepID=A0A512DFM2_9CELL|nr:PQQ-binding-like beta-propeller repeat protein [Cellulomonas aerilata]GEO35278.1 hypothetical protein CAE01nite_30030 [Cellulomonas aerilata]
MAAGGRDMRDVHLVESWDEPPAGGPAGAEPGAGVPGTDGAGRPPTSPRVRRRRRGVLVVAAAVATVVSVTAGVESWRDAARVRALADVRGVAAPLRGAIQPLWEVESPVGDVLEVGERLLTVLSGAGTVDAVALDAGTGQEAWRTTIGSAVATDGPVGCVVPGAPGEPDGADRPVLACVVTDRVATTPEQPEGWTTYPVAAHLVVLDARTGRLVSDRATTPGARLATAGQDLLLAEVGGDDHVRVSRLDPRTGETSWTFTSPDPAPADRFGLRPVWLQAPGDVVVVESGTRWVLSGAGVLSHTLDRDPQALPGPSRAAGGQWLVRFEEDPRGDPRVRSRVTDLVTGRSYDAPGFVVGALPDDGSLPGTLFVGSPDGTAVSAVDGATGEQLWTVEAQVGSWPMVLDGTVVLLDGGRLLALDGRTGAERWSVADDRLGAASSIVTDGQVVVASDGATRPGGEVVAFDLDDGRVRWSSDVGGPVSLAVHGHRVVGYDDRGRMSVLGDAR